MPAIRPAVAISQYMTRSPHSIGVRQPLAAAHRLMRKHRVRHLPVLADGRLVGLVSMRDLHFVETLQDVDVDTVPVEDAMTADPYMVPPDASLLRVARTMAQRKIGSAVVTDKGKVVGVFTTVDAMRALADLLDRART